jgi:transcriptional regulator with XRE-family HTH domain
MAIHIGKKIKEELYKQGISVSSFAKKINRSRNVVYNIFERESIDTALLNRIGLILRIDFFNIYSEQKEYKKDGINISQVREDKSSYTPSADQFKVMEKQQEALQTEIGYLKKIIAFQEEEIKRYKRLSKSKKQKL